MIEQSDGLARLQIQSRIPAATWRQWCMMLGLEPAQAIEVWERICLPVSAATQTIPDIAFVLQLRAEQLSIPIEDFGGEAAKMLHIYNFLYQLRDENLTRGKVKNALLRFYSSLIRRYPAAFTSYLTIEFAAVVLVSKVLGEVPLSGVLKPLVDGQGTVQQIVRLGIGALKEERYADATRTCLENQLLADSGAEAVAEVDGEKANDEDFLDQEVGTEAEVEVDAYLLDAYLIAFRAAMQKIYLAEATSSSEAEQEEAHKLLDARLKVLSDFKPVEATIPTAEELAESRQQARPKVKRRIVGGGRSASGGEEGGGGSSAAAAAGSGDAAVSEGGGFGASPSKSSGRPSARIPGPKSGAEQLAELANEVDAWEEEEQSPAVEMENSDVISLQEILPDDFSSKVHQVAQLLSSIEKYDHLVWNIVNQPTMVVEDLQKLGRNLDSEGTSASTAFDALKGAAQYIGLKKMVQLPGNMVTKNRKFSVDLTHFINAAKSPNVRLRANDKRLVAFKRIFDYVAAALLRLQTLKVNSFFARLHPESYTKEAVELYCEQSLDPVLGAATQTLMNALRNQATAETETMLAAFIAEHYVELLLGTIGPYVEQLPVKDAIETLQEALEEQPFAVEPPQQWEEALGPMPDELLELGKLGPVFDAVSSHICTQVWSVLQPAHQPEEVVAQILALLHQLLVDSISFEPEKRRPQESPKVPLAVVSLAKVSNNANLQNLYARLREDGRLMYADNYKDGSFVDLYELREYTPVRMQGNASKKAAETGEDQLQTGHKYLFSLGRTRDLSGDTPAEVIETCERRPDGGIKVFPMGL